MLNKKLNQELEEKFNSSNLAAFCYRKSSKCFIVNCPGKFKVLTPTALFLCPMGKVLTISREVTKQ